MKIRVNPRQKKKPMVKTIELQNAVTKKPEWAMAEPVNFVLDDILDMKQIGIRLTESGAMKPHASVSGLMFSHPQARYFNVGKIGEDQLQDYARRRGLPIEVVRKFLASNL